MKGRRGKPSRLQLHSRPPLERMVKIHAALQQGDHPNATTLARVLETSTKTIHRDVGFMRDRLLLPIEFSVARNGYFYTSPVESFPMLEVREGELFALLIAEKALQQYRGTAFERQLTDAFQKLSAALPDTVSIRLEDWDQAVSFQQTSQAKLGQEVIDDLCRAAAQRQQLKLTYHTPGTSSPKVRVVDPHHVANVNGEWYLFAFDHLRKAMRTFSPGRILALAETGSTFVRRAGFSVEKHLAGAFGVMSGPTMHDIQIRFAAEVAHLIREKKWHRTQKLAELPNGGVELSLRLNHLAEIRRWILGWGSAATVLAPPELQQQILEEAQRIIAQRT